MRDNFLAKINESYQSYCAKEIRMSDNYNALKSNDFRAKIKLKYRNYEFLHQKKSFLNITQNNNFRAKEKINNFLSKY